MTELGKVEQLRLPGRDDEKNCCVRDSKSSAPASDFLLAKCRSGVLKGLPRPS
jgi:hypothetical protein